MSHSIFDGLSVISLEGTGLTVQQLLDSSLIQNAVAIDDQSVTSTNSTIEHLNSNYTSISVIDEGVSFDEDDLFQCGRCKLQFSSLEPFMIHKRNQCPSLTVKKYINEVTISASSPSARDCATPSSPSALNQVSSSTVSQNDLPQVETQEEVDQSDKFDCSLASALTSTVSESSESVVVSGGDFFSLTLDNTQDFTLQENLELTSGNGSEKDIIKPESSLFETSTSTSVTKPSTTSMTTMISISESQSPLTSDVVSSVVKNAETLLNGTDIQDIKVEYEEELSSDLKQSSKYPRSILPNQEVLGKGSVPIEPLKDRRKHTCMFCNKAFSKNFDLRQHIRSHTGEKPFQCIVCGRAFAQKSNVKKHMITHKFWPKDALCNTLPKEPIKKVLFVSSNGENGDDNGNMKEEILFDNSYVCPFCNSAHSTYLDLRSHMKEHRDQKVYHCIQKDCDETFADLDEFLSHTRGHDDKGLQYRCHTCSKLFNSLPALGFHHFEHSIYPWPKKSGPSYFRCTKCMNKYATAEALDHHLKMTKHHFPCKQCSKVFSSERLLRTHLRVHGNTNLFTCATCCKDLKSEHSLKVHQLIHTGERPFECNICKGAFNRKDKLKRHMLVHEPKKFKCPYGATLGCQKEYSRKDKLRLHLSHAHSNTLKLISKKGENLKSECDSVLTKDLQMEKNNQNLEANSLTSQGSGVLKKDDQSDLASKLEDCKKDDVVIEISLQPEENKPHQGIGSSCIPTSNASSTITLGSQVPNASSLPTLGSSVPAKIRVRKHRRVLSNIKDEIPKKQISSNKEPIIAKDTESSNALPVIVEGTLPCAPTTYSSIDKDLFKDNAGITADVAEPTNVISILDHSESQSIDGEPIENDDTFIASLTEEVVVEDFTGNNKLEVLYIPFALTTQSDFIEPKSPDVDGMLNTTPNIEASIVDDGSGRSFFVSTEEFENLENLSAEILLTEQDIHVVQTHDENPHINSRNNCVSNVQGIRNNIFVVKGIVDREENGEDMEVTLDGTRTIILQSKDD